MHYDHAKPGQWTYHPDPWCQMAIFRKDGAHDSVKTGARGFHQHEAFDDDWAFYSGDAAIINEPVLDRMLDLMNWAEVYERGQAELHMILDAQRDDPVHDWYSEEQP